MIRICGRHVCPEETRTGPRQNGRRRGTVASFAHPDKHPCAKQDRERGRQTRPSTGQTPKGDADRDEPPARHSIRQPTEDRRSDHVAEQKRSHEQSGLAALVRIAGQKLCSDSRQDCGQNVAVDVIEKIDGQEQPKRYARTARYFSLGLHRKFLIAA